LKGRIEGEKTERSRPHQRAGRGHRRVRWTVACAVLVLAQMTGWFSIALAVQTPGLPEGSGLGSGGSSDAQRDDVSAQTAGGASVAETETAGSGQSLLLALQREFAYLREERQALLSQKEAAQTEIKRSEQEQSAELAQLEQRVIQAQLQADKLEAEWKNLKAGDESQTYTTLYRALAAWPGAGAHLGAGGEKVRQTAGSDPSAESGFEGFRSILRKRLDSLSHSGVQWLPEAVVHGPEGAIRKIPVVSLGGLAFVGQWDDSGLWTGLLPLEKGDGLGGRGSGSGLPSFELVEHEVEMPPGAERAPVSSSEAQWLPFVSLELARGGKLQAHLKQEQSGLRDLVEKGGPIGVVILFLGALSFVMALFRAGWLAAQVGQIRSALRALRRGRLTVTTRSGSALWQNLSRAAARTDAVEKESALSDVVAAHQETLDRGATVLTVVAASAPLLGLLGTVTGMIATFDTIAVMGTANPAQLSGGISEALVTTMLGLVVAIPSLFLSHLLNAWARQGRNALERCACLSLLWAASPASAHSAAGAEGVEGAEGDVL
jgi:biopolymer transport protein ExbB/TolQ